MEMNLTEIVRAEVKTLLQEMIAKTLKEEVSKVFKSGDYITKDVKPLDDTIVIEKAKVVRPLVGVELPVKVVKNGTIQHRRAKRTQAEMRQAIINAMPAVKAKHPDWSERRLRRLAKNLVRRYKL